MIRSKDVTLNIQQIDERSADLVNQAGTKEALLQMQSEVNHWKRGAGKYDGPNREG
jgi:hypothetical protein